MSAIHVEILKDARGHIEHGFNDYVCNAIEFCDAGRRNFARGREIRLHIFTLLCGHPTLNSWLRANYNLDTKQPDKMRETRLAWIDWLIEEWRDAP